MGKYLLLKDSAHTPRGYLRETKEGVACRAPLSKPSRAVLLFSGGEQAQFDLCAGGDEQMLFCDGKNMSGGYVVSTGTLLFATDDAARRAFETDLIKEKACSERISSEKNSAETDMGGLHMRVHEEKKRHEPETDGLKTDEGEAKEEEKAWPDRRWPPPPCWDTAVYRQGSWREE